MSAHATIKGDMTIMKRTTFLAIVSLAALAGFATTMQGDITAAIRASGGTTTMTADPVGIPSATSECLMNGKWKGERYLPSTESSGPVTFNFNVDGSFLPGEDVVVTALTFIVGGNDSGLWTDYGKRLPKAFTLRGSNDGGISWTPIVSVETVEAGAFTSYTDDTEKYTYAETVSFVNWRSYRSYQITVTKAMESRWPSMAFTAVRLRRPIPCGWTSRQRYVPRAPLR